MCLPCIQVDEKKLKAMMSEVWSSLESPLVAIPVDYRLYARKKSLRSGYVLVTRGAVYVFKSKFMKPVVFDKKIHILDMRKITITKDNMMVIEFDDYNAEIKTKSITSLYAGIFTVLREVTFGVVEFRELPVESEIPLPRVEITERIPEAIRWRALFLAHFYDIKGGQLHTMTYFDKWESKKTPMLVLGPSFHPGNFAAAFGHAIGWESLIDTCCFQNFAPTSFARMLLSILENASTIDRLAFSDYKVKEGHERRLPQFPTTTIARTSIKEWWILRSTFEIVRNFCTFAKNLPEPIQDLTIATTAISDKEFDEFNSFVEQTPALKNMRSFQYIRNISKKFPVTRLNKLLLLTTNLQILTIRGLEANGSDALSCVCAAKTNIKVLNITHMQFRSPISDKCDLPKSLVNLNMSLNAMGPNTLKSIFQLVLKSGRIVPLTFQMAGMVFKEGCYKALEQIPLNTCQLALGEFDWSGNKMPGPEETKFFFNILSTQRNLRHLKFDEMECANPLQFLMDVITLMKMIHVPGFDVSGKFDPVMMNQFINALSQMTWLRRLGIRNSMCGDQGIPTILNLARTLTNLDEFLIDGLRVSSTDYIVRTWNAVANEKIIAVDLPNIEMKNKEMTENDLSEEQEEMFKLVKEKKRPTTIEQRTLYILSKIEEIEKLGLSEEEKATKLASISSPDLFKEAMVIKLSEKHRDDDPYQEKAPGEVDE